MAPTTGHGLRAELERTRAENALLRAKLIETNLVLMSINPGEGIGRAVVRQYPTDRQITPAAIGEWMRSEYGAVV
jgi:hypothetical protein